MKKLWEVRSTEQTNANNCNKAHFDELPQTNREQTRMRMRMTKDDQGRPKVCQNNKTKCSKRQEGATGGMATRSQTPQK